MRIHIMGPPGSGKTTLAQRLAACLNIPFYELDHIAWEEGYPGTERPLEVRLIDVGRIAAQPAWITEGVFLDWTDELLRSADHIVWLDMPWSLVLKRIIIRRLRRSAAGANPPSSLLKQLQFLTYVNSYYFDKLQLETRVFMTNHLLTYQHKLKHCRNPFEVEAFFTSILSQERGDQANCEQHPG